MSDTGNLHIPRSNRTAREPEPMGEPFESCDAQDHYHVARCAEAMAAAIDVMTHHGLIDARSLAADARLSLGDPWSEEEARERLSLYRPGGQ